MPGVQPGLTVCSTSAVECSPKATWTSICLYIDLVIVDWFMGYATKNRAEVGIFPKTYVCLKEAKIVQTGYVSLHINTILICQWITSSLLCSYQSVLSDQQSDSAVSSLRFCTLKKPLSFGLPQLYASATRQWNLVIMIEL